MKNNKILKLVAVVALIAAMAFAFVTFSEKPVEGSKAITQNPGVVLSMM